MTLVDAIARRYGQTPGDVVRMSADDFALAAMCVMSARDDLAQLAESASASEGIGAAVMGLMVTHAALVS